MDEKKHSVLNENIGLIKTCVIPDRAYPYILIAYAIALGIAFREEPIEKHSYDLILDGLFIYTPIVAMVALWLPVWLFLWTAWRIFEFLLMNVFALIFHHGYIHYRERLASFWIMGYYLVAFGWWNIRRLPPFNLSAPVEIHGYLF